MADVLIAPPKLWTPTSRVYVTGIDAGADFFAEDGLVGWAFDDTANEALISEPLKVLDGYASASNSTVQIAYCGDTGTANEIDWKVYIERWVAATTDLSALTNFDSAIAVNGTGGTPAREEQETETTGVASSAMDGIVAGDWCRVLLVRDSAGEGTGLSGDAIFLGLHIYQ